MPLFYSHFTETPTSFIASKFHCNSCFTIIQQKLRFDPDNNIRVTYRTVLTRGQKVHKPLSRVAFMHYMYLSILILYTFFNKKLETGILFIRKYSTLIKTRQISVVKSLRDTISQNF